MCKKLRFLHPEEHVCRVPVVVFNIAPHLPSFFAVIPVELFYNPLLSTIDQTFGDLRYESSNGWISMRP